MFPCPEQSYGTGAVTDHARAGTAAGIAFAAVVHRDAAGGAAVLPTPAPRPAHVAWMLQPSWPGYGAHRHTRAPSFTERYGPMEFLKPLRRFARALRHTPDRILHPVRRRRALRRLAARGGPGSVLFVCYGNICRSPYAAAAFAAALPEALVGRVSVASAGFLGGQRPSPPEAIRVAARRGYDLDAHRSTPLGRENAGGADLVVVMDAAQCRAIRRRYGRRPEDVLVLGDLDPDPIDTRAIRDPVDQPEEVFEESYARIDRCLGVLVAAAAAGVPERQRSAR